MCCYFLVITGKSQTQILIVLPKKTLAAVTMSALGHRKPLLKYLYNLVTGGGDLSGLYSFEKAALQSGKIVLWVGACLACF